MILLMWVILCFNVVFALFVTNSNGVVSLFFQFLDGTSQFMLSQVCVLLVVPFLFVFFLPCCLS